MTAALGRLRRGDKLMVWCGLSHHYKGSVRTSEGPLGLMGSRFQRAAQITPFCIDQCLTVHWNVRALQSWQARRHRRVLEQFGGTAGYLVRKTVGPVAGRLVDAIIRSVHNELR